MARGPTLELLVTAKNATTKAFTDVKSQVQGLTKGLSSATESFRGLGALFGVGLSAKWLVDVNVEFERLRAQLRAFSRDNDDATEQFDMIREFAVETPFELQDLTQAWIQLRAAGLRPTVEEFRALGDFASAMGKPIEDLGVAIRASVGGSVERLNQFGTTARIVGDKIAITFQGQTTVVDRTARAVQAYYVNLTRAAGFTGSMQRQAQTLGGAISNLTDAFSNFAASIGEGGLASAVASMTRGFTGMLNALTEWQRLTTNTMPKQQQMEMDLLNLQERRAELQEVVNRQGYGAPTASVRREAATELAIVQQMIRARELEAKQFAAARGARARQDQAARDKQEADDLARLRAEAADAAAAALRDEIKMLNEAAAARMLNVNQVERLYQLQTQLYVQARDTTTDLTARVTASQQLVEVEKALAATRAGKLVRSEGRAGDVSIPGVDAAEVLRRVAAPGLPDTGPPLQFGMREGEAINLRRSLDEMLKAIPELQPQVQGLTQTFDALGASIEAAFAAMVDGSMTAGAAFEATTKAAIAGVAREYARLEFAKAAGALAMGNVAGAAGHTAAGAAFSAIAGSLQGSVNRAARGVGGVGGGAFGVVPTTTGLGAMGETRLVINGGLLNMNDPRQADALARAMQTLSGRRVVVEVGA